MKTSHEIYQLTRTCPVSENRADWDNKKWYSEEDIDKARKDQTEKILKHLHFSIKIWENQLKYTKDEVYIRDLNTRISEDKSLIEQIDKEFLGDEK